MTESRRLSGAFLLRILRERRESEDAAMAVDPRKSVARLSQAAEAAPFDRAAVEALLSTTTAWPVAKGGGVPIHVVHEPATAVAPFRHRKFSLSETRKWAANAALAVFAIGAGVSAFHD